MANPQKEKGFVGIAYDLFEQFFIRDFTLKQLKVLLLLIRFSYGFGKKVAKIKPQRLFELAYIYRCDIKEELRYLKQNKVIKYNSEFGEFQINKNYDEWKISYHKLFNEDDLIKLKKINIEAIQIAKDFDLPDEVTPEIVSETQTDVFVNNKQAEGGCLQNTNNFVCEKQTDVFVNNKQVNAEKASGSTITNTPIYKDIEVIENNNTYICNNEELKKEETKKLDDPYLGKTQAAFCAEYQKVFKKSCYLNNKQRIALVEINADNPEFISLLPVLISKFSKIRFDFEGKKQGVGLRWLLEEGNWSGVLSGDFDDFIEEENVETTENTLKREDGWDL